MSDYPEAPCKNQDIHQPHTHYDNKRLETCLGVGDNQEYVYRLVYEDSGTRRGTYMGQHVYHNLGSARGQQTKHNKSWHGKEEKVVIQRGLIKWSEDPV